VVATAAAVAEGQAAPVGVRPWAGQGHACETVGLLDRWGADWGYSCERSPLLVGIVVVVVVHTATSGFATKMLEEGNTIGIEGD
jgi:hypothetical protein